MWQQSQKQESQDQLDGAIASLKGVLAIDRKVPPDDIEQFVRALRRLASLYILTDELAAARETCREYLTLDAKRLGAGHFLPENNPQRRSMMNHLDALLERQASPAESAASMLLVGEVDYDALAGTAGPADSGRIAALAPRTRNGQLMHWQPLNNTRQEVVSIRDSFEERFPEGRCKLLRKDQAAVGKVRAEIDRYRYVHFATHGSFAPPDAEAASGSGRESQARSADEVSARQELIGFHPGLLSGLVLAGANRPVQPEQDDGILTALEVAQLDLGRVDLATLSACETGLGKWAAGEGLLGLQRVFQVAGARTVVATLWKIDDAAGRQLMIDFYDNLWAKKLPRVEALRAAQLTMLREGVTRGMDFGTVPAEGKRRLPPFFWAGFVLSGDWR